MVTPGHFRVVRNVGGAVRHDAPTGFGLQVARVQKIVAILDPERLRRIDGLRHGSQFLGRRSLGFPVVVLGIGLGFLGGTQIFSLVVHVT